MPDSSLSSSSSCQCQASLHPLHARDIKPARLNSTREGDGIQDSSHKKVLTRLAGYITGTRRTWLIGALS